MANYTVTLPSSNITPLILNERSQQPGDFSIRYQIPYTVVSTAGGTASTDTITVVLGATPTTWLANGLLVDIPVAFAGTTALTCTIGTTTTATAFASSFSVLTAGVYVPPNGTGSVNTPASANGTTSVTLQAVFTNATGGSPSGLTTGFMTILLGIYDPTQSP